MTVDGLLSLLKSRGLSLSVDGDRIKISGPPAAKTDSLMTLVKGMKKQLIDRLAKKSEPKIPCRRIVDRGLYRDREVERTITEVDWKIMVGWLWPQDDIRYDRKAEHEVWANAAAVLLTLDESKLL